jgi:hypothetical protein
MTAHDEIIEAVGDRWGTDPHDLADQIAAGLSHGAMVYALGCLLSNIQRVNARKVEDEVFRAATATTVPKGIGPGRQVKLDAVRAQFAPLFKTQIAVGDGHTVTWGSATVAQHRMRIAMLEGKIGGLSMTVQRHKMAISLIESAGVTCLEEIGWVKPKRERIPALASA